MTPERLAEITAQAAILTYPPTKRAADELLAEIARLRAALTRTRGTLDDIRLQSSDLEAVEVATEALEETGGIPQP